MLGSYHSLHQIILDNDSRLDILTSSSGVSHVEQSCTGKEETEVMKKTQGNISSWRGTCGFLLCKGCLDKHDIKTAEDSI